MGKCAGRYAKPNTSFPTLLHIPTSLPTSPTPQHTSHTLCTHFINFPTLLYTPHLPQTSPTPPMPFPSSSPHPNTLSHAQPICSPTPLPTFLYILQISPYLSPHPNSFSHTPIHSPTSPPTLLYTLTSPFAFSHTSLHPPHLPLLSPTSPYVSPHLPHIPTHFSTLSLLPKDVKKRFFFACFFLRFFLSLQLTKTKKFVFKI